MKSVAAKKLAFYSIFISVIALIFFIARFTHIHTSLELHFYILFSIFIIFAVGTYHVFVFNQKKIQKMLDYDDLTGLITVKKFKEEISEVLKDSKSEEYSIIAIDISKFRYLKETLGSETANSVLIQLAKHFERTVPKGSFVCRNYEDNFLVFIKATFRPIIEDYVVSLLSVVERMGNLLPLHYTMEFSVGVYVILDVKDSVESMIDKANTARNFALKSFNPRRIAFYDDNMHDTTQNERNITLDMNRAFEENEFVAFYQPKFRFQDTKVIGAEALVRWKHKTKGLLNPGAFVPLFEKNGFIQKIDMMVFESVCKFLDKWNKSGENGECPAPITISCNLSRIQLYNPDVAKTYSEIAKKYQIAPSKIEIELTESLMMDNKDRLLKAMNEIKKAGFEISVDDFGSGFSSLGLLKDIPANVIKLDKSFLDAGSDREHIIINSVINMAKDLKLKTVAEGIEDKEQADLLKKMGCDIAQGYLYAKPMPEKDFEQLLHSALD